MKTGVVKISGYLYMVSILLLFVFYIFFHSQSLIITLLVIVITLTDSIEFNFLSFTGSANIFELVTFCTRTGGLPFLILLFPIPLHFFMNFLYYATLTMIFTLLMYFFPNLHMETIKKMVRKSRSQIN